MANIAGLDSIRSDRNEDENEDENKYYVGGADGRGGGSGLSVVGPGSSRNIDNIFSRVERTAEASSLDGSIKILFYKNGFQVDDGPFRPIDDPQNQSFLDDISKGIVPRELEFKRGEQMNVNIVDKRSEVYVPPSYTAFSGEGQSMRSDTSLGAVSGGANVTSNPMIFDGSQPSTLLQIRLHNGKRIREKFNHSHTVSDIQSFLNLSGEGNSPYILLAGYPPVPLVDVNQTIADANLQGGTITQKLI